MGLVPARVHSRNPTEDMKTAPGHDAILKKDNEFILQLQDEKNKLTKGSVVDR